jgi:MinD superfamily P-loop ATPase
MAINKKIAVLSGKGGTGKTLVSVNLAAADGKACYADCDVEEPDGNLFFKSEIYEKQDVFVKIPKINREICCGCKKCVNFCRFNALAFGKKPIVFDEVCHSCGGCVLVCPTKAITEVGRKAGIVEIGISGQVKTVAGKMNPGEASGIPIIKKLLGCINDTQGTVYIDCPPGSSCIVMESVKYADYCILVAEPTVFGAHNLAMVYELVKYSGKPCGVVLNKYGAESEYNPSEEFCRRNGIDILIKIPFDKELGAINSDGKIAVRENYGNKKIFYTLLAKVKEAAV